MQYRQDADTEQLDRSGHVTKQQETVMIVRPGAPHELQVVSVKGDRIPSDPDEAAREAKGQEAERRKHDFSLKNFVTRFNITSSAPVNISASPSTSSASTPSRTSPTGIKPRRCSTSFMAGCGSVSRTTLF